MADLQDLMKGAQDALQGVSSGLTDVTKKTEDANKAIGTYQTSMDKFGATANTALGLLSAGISKTNPALASTIGSIQKLIPNLVELGNAAKATGSLMKAMTSPAGLLTLITLLTTVITNFDNIAETIGFSGEQIENFKTKATKALDKIIGVVAGVGNAILQYITAPFKGVIAAINVFKEEGIKGLKNAGKAYGDAVKEGFKFKANFQEGQTAGAEWIEGVHSRKNKEKAKEAGKAVAKEVAEGLKKLPDYMASAFSEDDDFILSYFGVGKSDIKKRRQEALAKEIQDILDNAIGEIDPESIGGMDEIANSLFASLSGEKSGTSWDDIKGNVKNYGDLLKNTSDLMANVGSAYEASITKQVESGKLSVKEGKKRLKQEATIQGALAMAAGITGSVYSLMEAWKSAPGGWIGKAAAAIASVSAVVATTISSVNSIKAAGEGLSSGSAPATASVTPSAASQTYIANPTSNQDVVDAVNNNTSVTSSVQTVLVVDDYKKVADQANRVQVQSSF